MIRGELKGGIVRLADLVSGSLLLVAARALDSLSGVRRRLRPIGRGARALLGWLLTVLALFAAGIGIYAAALHWWPLLVASWSWCVAGLAPVVALGAWWLWWRLPQREVDRRSGAITDAKTRADVEDNFRKTIGQLLGGAAVLIGAGFAYLQFTQQQQAARDLFIANQVSKGFELLGNKDNQPQQRLGGIYALEGVMNGSKQYSRPVLEALCAFVRDETQAKLAATRARNATTAGATPRDSRNRSRAVTKTDTEPEPPASDIQAALTVIGRRVAREDAVPHFHNAHIPKADLTGAYMMGADLSGADLTGANLTGANLTGANLMGANLTGASLTGADLVRANLTGANLTGAELTGANLRDANLTDANLFGANLTGANLFVANLDRANLIGGNLTRAYLNSANITGANLTDASGLTAQQLDKACGLQVRGLKPSLSPPPTIKPCPKPSVGDQPRLDQAR